MSARIAILHSVAVYDGQRHLGDIAELGNGQYAALSKDAQRLGIFDKRTDAQDLIPSRRSEKGDADGE